MSAAGKAVTPRAPEVSPFDRHAIVHAQHTDPHTILGAHPIDGGHVVVRAFHPSARSITCVPAGAGAMAMKPQGDGLFAVVLPRTAMPVRYRLEIEFTDGGRWQGEDPYRFLPTLGEQDLHYFNEGTHRRLWEVMGAHRRVIEDVEGVSFAVWAPNARRVSVVGDFCHFDGRIYLMRSLGSSGVFELFIPGIADGACYKFEILGSDGIVRQKADPFAAAAEHPPKTASRIFTSHYRWNDDEWMCRRGEADPTTAPMAIYEVHLGSWTRVPEEGNRVLSYRELAPRLVEHAERFGFTHLELMPVSEFPFDGSWGYQVTGYFAPTSRFGNPDDFRYFIDYCHGHGIGVILDWVPAHFPKDEFALPRFDGTALYEHSDPRQGEHPDWGTLIFNYDRAEVRGFLIASGLHWLDRYHLDGLRVDAVASMLYLDYSRAAGEWVANEYGGRENLGAIEFLRNTNRSVVADYPGCVTIAEESTAWPGVTRSIDDGGLGFTLKWNLGWMHDTLTYFSKDPIYRGHHQDDLCFAMIYERHERFVMPLSHDEVVHGKGSLLSKMAGDPWQKLANLRAMLTYMYTRPGKKLLFMGAEIASCAEWNAATSLDWHLADNPDHAQFARFLADLGAVYRDTPALWQRDYRDDGYEWIDLADRDNCVLSYVRRGESDHTIVVLNLTPVPRAGYRVGTPAPGRYVQLLSSDRREYGGSDTGTAADLLTEPVPMHGRQQSVTLTLPPLGALVLIHRG